MFKWTVDELTRMSGHDGAIALVTGGSSGIGEALGKVLHQDGVNVALLARTRDTLEQARAEIEALPGGTGFVDVLPADVTDPGSIGRAVEGLLASRGRIDYLFNCAGKAEPGLVEQYSVADHERAMRLDYLGTVAPVLAVLPGMIARGSGHIINISSVAGFIGLIGYGTYAPAKFAVMGYSEVLRHELKPKGIKVSVACPPDVDTPGYHEENMTKPDACKAISEKGKLMHPDDVARAIWAGVRKGKFLILPGEASFLHGMKRLLPSLVYKTLDGDLKKALTRTCKP